ncbi:UDP-4-amino-4,6-dideoxy-N-acetyl-beta-L-altrosamine transaminase [Pseudomonadota bacterium]|nr:UDP-4-amino-4,6-dideoxy-N-acetyl-beta-L-altrosamine transaminase [Pseudomonadota bacterium]
MTNIRIKYGRQEVTQDDIAAVVQVLNSELLTQGPVVPAFEKALCDYTGSNHSIAVNSATSALHIACMALDLGPGDTLWTCPNTFVASSNCAIYCGAMVDFVDMDPKTYNMDIKQLESKLKKAKINNNLPKVLVPVHLSGQSCQMQEIHELSKEYGFKIIEDASHAIGGSYMHSKVGSCQFSDITVFSFHPVKIITTGEGGAALTNNSDLANKLVKLRSHGITADQAEMDIRPEDEIWNYQQVCLGYNYRMTDIAAALGLSQLKRVDLIIKKRNEIASRYNQELADLPLSTPWQHPDTLSSYHLYIIQLNLNKIKKTQPEIYDELRNSGILVNLHYIPVYRQPFYESMGFEAGYCPESEAYHQRALSIPMYSSLSLDDQNYVIETLKKVII